MNKEAILAVADVIEFVNGGRFNLGEWACMMDDNDRPISRWADAGADPQAVIPNLWNSCDTAGCIAGWTCAWADLKPNRTIDIQDVAGAELGLNRYQSYKLFVSSEFWREHVPGMGQRDISFVTAAQAADVMRKVANGEIEL